jgi:hypothetical protein
MPVQCVPKLLSSLQHCKNKVYNIPESNVTEVDGGRGGRDTHSTSRQLHARDQFHDPNTLTAKKGTPYIPARIGMKSTAFWDMVPCSFEEVPKFQRCVLPPTSRLVTLMMEVVGLL